MPLIDTHCHIDLYPNPHKTAREADKLGILTVSVTNLPSHFEIGYLELMQYKNIRPALGLHPLLSHEHSQKELTTFARSIDKTSYIGEVGLDYSREGKATFNKQLESFRFVLKTINNRPRFVTVHSRGAEEKLLELLDEFKIKNAVFHWFTGPIGILEEAVKAGHYFSVNSAMVYSQKGRQLIENMPREKVLTESDGPHILSKNNPVDPKEIRKVVSFLYQLWNVPYMEAEQQVFANFMRIMSIVRRSKT